MEKCERGGKMLNIREFFTTLYPTFETNSNKINIRCIPIKREIAGKKVWPKSENFTELEGAINYSLKMDKLGTHHVFFTCPELKSDAKNATQENIMKLNFLFTDIDPDVKNEKGEIIRIHTKKELMERIKVFPLPPSLVVDSGGGYHLYWLLDKPIEDKWIITTLLQEIQEGLDGDKNAIKLTQLLRAPGTHNRKSKAIGVKVVSYNPKKYSLVDIYAKLGIDPTKVKEESIERPTSKQVTATKSDTKIHPEGIRFDFTKKIKPLNITTNDYHDLLDIIKKQNILKASNFPEYYISRSFNCCLHNDANPSANVFVSKEGYYYYKCFGCGQNLDIIGLYQKITNKDFANSLVDLAAFFGIKCDYSKWIQQQINKYHYNRVNLLHFNCEDNKIKYPNLYKLLNRRTLYLSLMNDFGAANIKSEKYSYENENVFFLSYGYFTNYYRRQGLCVTEATTIRNFNLFCALGLIKKIPLNQLKPEVMAKALEQAKKTTIRLNKIGLKKYQEDEIKSPNFYVIYNLQDRLRIAEERAKKLMESGFTVRNCVNKDFFILCLGQEVADEVYPDERVISKRNVSIANRLESTLVKLIRTQGYATKKQIVTKTNLSGRLKANRRKKEMELDKNLGEILAKYDLEYRKANKFLMEKFNLQSSIFIITRKK